MGACLSLSGRFARFGRQAASGLEAWRSLTGAADVIIEDDGSDRKRLAAVLPDVASRCDLLLGPYSTVLMRTAGKLAAERDWLINGPPATTIRCRTAHQKAASSRNTRKGLVGSRTTRQCRQPQVRSSPSDAPNWPAALHAVTCGRSPHPRPHVRRQPGPQVRREPAGPGQQVGRGLDHHLPDRAGPTDRRSVSARSRWRSHAAMQPCWAGRASGVAAGERGHSRRCPGPDLDAGRRCDGGNYVRYSG